MAEMMASRASRKTIIFALRGTILRSVLGPFTTDPRLQTGISRYDEGCWRLWIDHKTFLASGPRFIPQIPFLRFYESARVRSQVVSYFSH